MFGTLGAKINPGSALPPPGSPLRIRNKEDAGQWDANNGDVEVGDVIEAQRLRIVFMLLKGNIYGLPGSDGTRWGNFREWAKNQHPVLSMFFAHELHPFSKSERLSVMLCYLCWAFFITIVFEGINVDYSEVCDAGCNNVYRGTLPGESSRQYICGPLSGSNEDQVSWTEYQWNCDQITPWWVLSFLIALCTVPYSTILKFLATCACAQSLPKCLKGCVECLGALVLKLFGVLSVLWLTLGVVMSLEFDGGMFLITYLTGVVKSWMYWPIIAGAVFTYKYKKQRAAFDEANPGQVAIAWPVDHTDPNMEVKVGKDGKPVAYVSPPGSPGATPAATAAMNGGQQPQMHAQARMEANVYGAGGVPCNPGMHGQFYGNGGGDGGKQLVMQQHMAQQPVLRPGSPLMPTPSDVGSVNGNMYGGSAPPLQQAGFVSPQPGYAPQQMGMGNTPPMYGGGTADGGIAALPPGWEMKMEPDGRMLYIDHNTKTTQWNPPLMQHQVNINQPPGSPPGSPPSYALHQHQHQHLEQHPPPGMHGMGGYPPQQPVTVGYPNAAMGGFSDPMQQQQQQQQQQHPMGGFPGQLPLQQQYQHHYQQQPPQPQAPAQAPAQATAPVAAPAAAPVIMEFAVPDGVSAGDTVQINSTKGVISVTIPAGSKSGDTLQIPMPA
eukprot:g5711.t1